MYRPPGETPAAMTRASCPWNARSRIGTPASLPGPARGTPHNWSVASAPPYNFAWPPASDASSFVCGGAPDVDSAEASGLRVGAMLRPPEAQLGADPSSAAARAKASPCRWRRPSSPMKNSSFWTSPPELPPSGTQETATAPSSFTLTSSRFTDPTPRSLARGAMDHTFSAELEHSPGLSRRSSPVETSLSESMNSTPITGASCPPKCATGLAVETFQTHTTPSSQPAASSVLSGENAVRQTRLVNDL